MLKNSTVYEVILHYKDRNKTVYLPIIPRIGDSVHSPFHDNALINVKVVLINPLDSEEKVIIADCFINLDFN